MRRARLAGLVLLALGGSGCAWFGGDDEPIEPPAELTEFEPTLDVNKVWQAEVGPGSELRRLDLRPAVEGGRVYAAGRGGRVVALDLADGRQLWSAETELALSAGPAVGGGMVAVGSSDGVVAAFDAADGTPLWQVRVSGEVLATPAIADNLVMVRTVDGRLRALRGNDGEELWRVEHKPPRLSLRGTGAPVVAGRVVLLGFDNGRVGAYTLREGEVVWENLVSTGRGRTELERLADVDSDLKVLGQDVYAASFNGRVANLALESGQILWTSDMSSYNGIGVDWTTVYVADAAGEVVAVNRSSGAQLWRQNALRQRGTTAPTPFGQSVVVGDFEGYLHWMDALTGALQARIRADDVAIITAPVGAGEYLVVQDEADGVFAFRVEPRG